MSSKFFTMGNCDKNGLEVLFDFYLSEDCPPPGTPPKKILKHRKAKVSFKDGRDAQNFFNILVLGISRFEITD